MLMRVFRLHQINLARELDFALVGQLIARMLGVIDVVPLICHLLLLLISIVDS